MIDISKYRNDPDKYHRAIMVTKLMQHHGHHLYVALYGDKTNPHNTAIECVDCGEVMIDWNHPDADDLRLDEDE